LATNGPIVHAPGDKLYTLGDPWWNDIDRGKASDSSTTAIWQSYQQSHLVAKQEDLAKEIMNLTLRSTFVHISKVYSHTVKSYWMGPTALLPPTEGVLRNFIALSRV
jgi:hypothetical protein